MTQPWIIISGVTFFVALGTLLFKPRDTKWAAKLNRPSWLFFEPAIPLIWTLIFICGAISAILVWQQDPGTTQTWFLMAVYLLLEMVTVAYIPSTLRARSLKVGTALGGFGVILAAVLALTIWPVSHSATLLLFPYLLWSPIGTLTTWQMMQLNPDAS